MYNVKGPSKIVAKTARRGIPQNIDNMREYAKNNNNNSVDDKENENMSIPKPVFHKKAAPNQHRQEAITPQQEEIISFINDSWCALCTENGHVSGCEGEVPENQPVYYEEEPNTNLRNFKAFDLESWWGKRLYAHLTESTNGKN